MTQVFDALRGHVFLKNFADEDIQLLTSVAQFKPYPPRKMLLNFQQPANAFWLLLSGQVVLLNHIPGGGVRAFETISAPDVIGWSWLIPPYVWHFDVKAQSAIETIEINAPALRDIMQESPEFASRIYPEFMAVLLKRLQAARLQGLDIYRKPSGRLL